MTQKSEQQIEIAAGVVLHWIGGNCPVQAEGTIDEIPFYFRARGDEWSFSIGQEPVGHPDWRYTETYGVWPEAGWMEESEALAFINKAVDLYRKEKKR